MQYAGATVVATHLFCFCNVCFKNHEYKYMSSPVASVSWCFFMVVFDCSSTLLQVGLRRHGVQVIALSTREEVYTGKLTLQCIL